MSTIAISRYRLAAMLVMVLAGQSTQSAAHAALVAAEALPAGFTSHKAPVNGTTLHYVLGGQGPTLILIHGFPENWSAFAKIMPRLATRFRVVAVDLRGIGGSTPIVATRGTRLSTPPPMFRRRGCAAAPCCRTVRALSSARRDPPSPGSGRTDRRRRSRSRRGPLSIARRSRPARRRN
jgi:pimeloyl-ACP methyl ester carboxylesterase